MKELNNRTRQRVIEEKHRVKICGIKYTCRAGIVLCCFLTTYFRLEVRIWIREKEEAGNCKYEEPHGVGKSRYWWLCYTGESGGSTHTEQRGYIWQGTNVGLRKQGFV